jgi:hypothetical protein
MPDESDPWQTVPAGEDNEGTPAAPPAKKKARPTKNEGFGPYLMACGGCAVLFVVIAIGVSIAAYVTLRPGGAFRFLIENEPKEVERN